MAALKSPVKESNLLTRIVYKFICRHLTQNAPGPIPEQRRTWPGLMDPPRHPAPVTEWGRGRGRPAPVPIGLLTAGFRRLGTSGSGVPRCWDVHAGDGRWGGVEAGRSLFLPFSRRGKVQLKDSCLASKRRKKIKT